MMEIVRLTDIVNRLKKRTAISTEEEQLETGTQKIPVSIRVFEKYIKDTKPMFM